MNRSKFLRTALGLIALSETAMKPFKNYNPLILIGKGNPQMVGSSFPILPEVKIAFEKMTKDAKNDGIEIKIVSAYRSYERQKSIWNSKFIKFEKQGFKNLTIVDQIIRYSSIPGTSRHHWGTDIDIIDGSQSAEGDMLLTKKFHGNGPYNKLRRWMEANAEKFGFLKPYNQNPERKGFLYEPWHYSYAEKSISMLNAYLELDAISLIKDPDLLGADLLDSKFIENYLNSHVLGIDATLL
jgi:LAS superfamily LD-carboxypeptidase LdcB